MAASSRASAKLALLIDLLKRKNGATIDEIVEATGWEAHSVRGSISGILKKKLGLVVSSGKSRAVAGLIALLGKADRLS